MEEGLRSVAVEMILKGDMVALQSPHKPGVAHDLMCVTSIHEGLEGISLTGYRMMMEGMMYTLPSQPYGSDLLIFN